MPAILKIYMRSYLRRALTDVDEIRYADAKCRADNDEKIKNQNRK